MLTFGDSENRVYEILFTILTTWSLTLYQNESFCLCVFVVFEVWTAVSGLVGWNLSLDIYQSYDRRQVIGPLTLIFLIYILRITVLPWGAAIKCSAGVWPRVSSWWMIASIIQWPSSRFLLLTTRMMLGNRELLGSGGNTRWISCLLPRGLCWLLWALKVHGGSCL